MCKSLPKSVLITLSIVISVNSSLGAVNYETRALTNDSAPGTIGDEFWIFEAPAINNSGQVGFVAGLNISGDSGIWSEGSGVLHLVARENEPAPDTIVGTTSGVFDVFGNLNISTAGLTAFKASLGIHNGLWVEGLDGLKALARPGSSAPGTSESLTFQSIFNGIALSASGRAAFLARLAGSGVDATNDRGIWSEATGTLMLVAREGDTAPGLDGNTVFSNLVNPVINAPGHTAFSGGLTGPGVDTLDDQGIWSDRNGALSAVIRGGDVAPGTESGVVFDNFGIPSINASGQIVFQGSFAGPSINDINNVGIWSEGSGALALVARKGDAAPGTDGGVTFAQVESNVVINGLGQVVFTGILTGPEIDRFSDEGVWFGEAGALKLIARDGEPAIGTPDGMNFFGFADPVLNASGQVAFYANLAGENVSSINNAGIWATDHNGVLQLIVREGEQFDVNDDPLIEDLRTIRAIRMIEKTGGQDGRPSPFNDAGQIAFKLQFAGGSEGIFVATIGIPGDLNGDGFVGVDDLNIILGNWNQNVTPGDLLAGDSTGDGFIGVDDLNILLSNWNAGSPPATAIPEPIALTMFGLCSGALLLRSTVARP